MSVFQGGCHSLVIIGVRPTRAVEKEALLSALFGRVEVMLIPKAG